MKHPSSYVRDQLHRPKPPVSVGSLTSRPPAELGQGKSNVLNSFVGVCGELTFPGYSEGASNSCGV
eukprot:1191088-Prorocentrum_minimum.AAC.2